MSSRSDLNPCELCVPSEVVAKNILAYARYDNNSLSRGQVLIIPKRHVAGFFDMLTAEQSAALDLLNRAQPFALSGAPLHGASALEREYAGGLN